MLKDFARVALGFIVLVGLLKLLSVLWLFDVVALLRLLAAVAGLHQVTVSLSPLAENIGCVAALWLFAAFLARGVRGRIAVTALLLTLFVLYGLVILAQNCFWFAEVSRLGDEVMLDRLSVAGGVFLFLELVCRHHIHRTSRRGRQ